MRVVVITMDEPNKYLFGEVDSVLEEQSGSRVCVHNLVRATYTPGEEGHFYINPILVCEAMWLDLRHYIGIGYLEEELKEKYLAWKRNYVSTDNPFDEDPHEGTD